MYLLDLIGYKEIIMVRIYNFEQYDFSGGLNVKDSEHMIADNQCIDIKNFYFDQKGALSKRNGSKEYNTSAIDSNPILSLFRFYKSSGSFQEFLCLSGSTLYKGDDIGGTWTSIKTGLTAGKRCSFAVWGDLCYMWNGYDTPMQYDGTTVSDVSGSPPNGKYVVFRKDRLYVAGDPNNPNRIYFCDTGNPTSWSTGSNYIDIRSNDGDMITGILPLGDSLVIYKNNSVWMLAGTQTSDFFLSMVLSKVGCMAPGTLVEYHNIHIFLHRLGVFSFNGVNAQILSEKIEPRILDINATYIAKAAGGIYKNHYWLSLTKTGDTENKDTYLLNMQLGAWTYFSGLSPNVFTSWNGPTDKGELFCGDSTNGFVWQLDTGTTDGSQIIETYFYSKYFSVENPEKSKMLRKLYFSTNLIGADIGVIIAVDWSKIEFGRTVNIASDGDSWDSATWDTGKWVGGEIKNIMIPVSAGLTGRYFAVKFFDSEKIGYKISGFSLDFSVKQKRYRAG